MSELRVVCPCCHKLVNAVSGLTPEDAIRMVDQWSAAARSEDDTCPDCKVLGAPVCYDPDVQDWCYEAARIAARNAGFKMRDVYEADPEYLQLLVADLQMLLFFDDGGIDTRVNVDKPWDADVVEILAEILSELRPVRMEDANA